MNKQLIEEQWRDYAELLSLDELLERLKPLEKFCGEEVELLLPSTVMGTDGPVLGTIFVCTQSYLSEVAIANSKGRFDLIDRLAVIRIDVTFEVFNLARPEGPPQVLPSITLEVMHGEPGDSSLTFIGGDREKWLERAKLLFPPTVILSRIKRALA